MKNVLFAALVTMLIFLIGCGGGGGGGSTTGGTIAIRGTVLWLATGGAPTPAATVQAGTNATTTNTADGSFTVNAPAGTSSVLVLYQPTGGDPVTFRFNFTPGTSDVELGDLVIGAQKVAVVGKVLRSTDNSAISGAVVRFAGREGTTLADGTYRLEDVAYDPNALGSFAALEGRVSASGFFPKAFNPVSGAVAGVVEIDDLLLSADTGTTPPDLPYTIFGTVGPASLADGTLVTLWLAGVPVRRFTTSGTGQYGFWVEPGNYVVSFQNPTNSKTSPDQAANLESNVQVLRRDATLQ